MDSFVKEITISNQIESRLDVFDDLYYQASGQSKASDRMDLLPRDAAVDVVEERVRLQVERASRLIEFFEDDALISQVEPPASDSIANRLVHLQDAVFALEGALPEIAQKLLDGDFGLVFQLTREAFGDDFSSDTVCQLNSVLTSLLLRMDRAERLLADLTTTAGR